MEYKLSITGRFCTPSLEDVEFVFPPGANFICGKNGAGKSSLLRAMTWTLFDCAVGDRGNQGKRPEGLYDLSLSNGIFSIRSGISKKEGLYFTGNTPVGELTGERMFNYAKFLNWLEIKPNSAYDTVLERIQFDQASPNIFVLSQRKLIESVTETLSPRARELQKLHGNLMTGREKLKTQLDGFRREQEILSGFSFSSVDEIEERIRLLQNEVRGRPEPFKLEYFERRLLNAENELKAREAKYAILVRTAEKERQELKRRLDESGPFDEDRIRSERDEILVRLTLLDREIRTLSGNIEHPRPCPACGAPLLERGNGYVVADVEAIEQAKNRLGEKNLERAEIKDRLEAGNQLLKLVEVKNRLVQLESDLVRETNLFNESKAGLKSEIDRLEADIRDAREAKPLWTELETLQRQLDIIRSNNERFRRFQTLTETIRELGERFESYDFHRSAGVRDMLMEHFVDQCGRFSESVNEVLYHCDLGKIEFVPELGDDGSIKIIRLRHLENGVWRPYAVCEESLKRILDWAAWMSNIRLNPKKVDELNLMLIDDLGMIFDQRLERFLDYMRQQPVVMLFSWAYREAGRYLKPVQTIVLEK